MGKRKKSSRKPMAPRKSNPLPSTFTCLFCNHERSVSVKLDRKAGIGQLDCRICGQRFQCAVNYLSAAVDVYGEWVDAADAVAKADTTTTGHKDLARTSIISKLSQNGNRNASRDEQAYSREEVHAHDNDDLH